MPTACNQEAGQPYGHKVLDGKWKDELKIRTPPCHLVLRKIHQGQDGQSCGEGVRDNEHYVHKAAILARSWRTC